jgi:hypothetical protein
MLNSNIIFFSAFKRTVNNEIENLQAGLILHDGFLPTVISSTLTGIEKAEIDFEETPKDEAASLLRKYATSPDVEAIALIFMADTVALEPGMDRKLPEDLRDAPDAREAIMAYIYTKDQSESRRIMYKKNGDNDYWFGDEGWGDPGTLTGRFTNPFKD